MSDYEIWKQLCNQAEDGISQLDRKYGHYCRSIVTRILSDEEDIEECINDIYFKIWASALRITPYHFKGYVATVARTVALDRLEKNMAQKRNPGTAATVLRELRECLPDSTEALIDSIVIRETLGVFLKKLSPKDRWVFMRRYWNFDETKDIAQMYDQSDDAIRMRLCRIRKKLKEELTKEGIDL